MGSVADLAERLWTGEESTERMQPVTTLLGLEQFGDGLAFLASFANVTVVDTAEGLVLIDTGSFFLADNNHSQIREWTKSPVHTAVYTHGHVDHAFGLEPFEKEQAERGGAKITVIAHEAVPARFERYQLTAGYNEAINARQFGAASWPTRYRQPDQTYRSDLMLDIGGERIELHHDRGETDDHTWAWFPGRKLLCPGDLFIWASPNCGNPQKVQRYPREWARALRKMAACHAEQLFPGHGPPIFGADRVRQALEETAELLELLFDRTLELMNQGARLNDILHEVKAPERLLDETVPAPGLRRTRVHRPQHLAPVRRLARRQSGAAQAGARRGSRARARGALGWRGPPGVEGRSSADSVARRPSAGPPDELAWRAT